MSNTRNVICTFVKFIKCNESGRKLFNMVKFRARCPVLIVVSQDIQLAAETIFQSTFGSYVAQSCIRTDPRLTWHEIHVLLTGSNIFYAFSCAWSVFHLMINI